MTVQDLASSSVNDTGTNGKIDTQLTHSGSGFDLQAVRQQLIAMRVKQGADSPIGNRCSNLIEQLRNFETNIHNRDVVAQLIARQMSELSELTK